MSLLQLLGIAMRYEKVLVRIQGGFVLDHVVKWNAAAPGADVAAVRQNLGMLVENGTISPDVNSTTTRTWGTTVGNTTFVVQLPGPANNTAEWSKAFGSKPIEVEVVTPKE